jgi:hypothetical protein
MTNQIVEKEYPRLAWLIPSYPTGGGTLAQRVGRHMQERSGALKV